ncbi:GbsR/MarR family transcriptional regulator [Streptomyces sp. 4N509B]|uniref:GbsR/MarR family transcriptional regulator n=1 Tax=Streptomyces sp. 4N509B TaxID=3457413 RepID=UPI003FD23779
MPATEETPPPTSDPPIRRETAADAVEESRAIERLAGRFAETGLSRMAARVFAALIVSPDGALTAAEIGQRLSISSGTVSTSVQYLSRLGLITREHVPGSRRDLYRILDDPWPDVFAIRGHWLREFAKSAEEEIDRLGDGAPGARERLAVMREFALFVMPRLDTIVVEWRRHRAAHAPTGRG